MANPALCNVKTDSSSLSLSLRKTPPPPARSFVSSGPALDEAPYSSVFVRGGHTDPQKTVSVNPQTKEAVQTFAGFLLQS